MRGCTSDTKESLLRPWLSVCGSCDGKQVYMTWSDALGHVRTTRVDKLQPSMFKRVPEDACGVNGVMVVDSKVAFCSRSFDLQDPKLRHLANVLKVEPGSKIQLREVAITIVDALEEKFKRMVCHGDVLTLQEVSETLAPLLETLAPRLDKDKSHSRRALPRPRSCRCLSGAEDDDREVPYEAVTETAVPQAEKAKIYGWDGSEPLAHPFVIGSDNIRPLRPLLSEYRAYAIGLVLLALYSNVEKCGDRRLFKRIVCNFLDNIDTIIRTTCLQSADVGAVLRNYKPSDYLGDLKHKLQHANVIRVAYDNVQCRRKIAEKFGVTGSQQDL